MTHPNTTRFSTRLRLLCGLALLIGLCIMLGGLARPAHAQSTLSVTDCSSDAQLQAAVAQANSDNAGDVITFACSGDIKLTSTLSITGSMTLDGSGQSVTLDGGDSTQVLSVNSGVSLALKALTIAHGLAVLNNGDGIYEGGGLFNGGGTVTISSSTFANNSAPASGSCAGGGDGGGLFNSGGTVTISSSTFSGNSANVDPCLNNGGSGGGLANDNGTVSISSSIFANNSATNGFGGGLTNGDPVSSFVGGTVTISSSTFSGNTVTANDIAEGGGLYNFGPAVSISSSIFANNSAKNGNSDWDGGGGLASESGTVSINSSSFTNNSAEGTHNFNGGGVRNAFSSTVNITNSTFSGNTSAERGGALHNGGGSTANITNSTFSGNSASNNSGGISNDGTVNIAGSIVAANTRGDCEQLATLNDQGYNLSSDSSCGFSGTGSLQNTDPKLGPLASNGGPTQTLALQQGSTAIDAIPLSANICPRTDQRGQGRPDTGESRCDMGAYEFADPLDNDLGLSNMPADLKVNATSPKGAVVTYTPPTVVDESGDSSTASVSCTPASGSTFAIGTTKVTCTASDSDDTNSPVSGSFQVVVKDVTAPTLSLPSTITVDATSPQGAPVSYTVTATDPDNAASELKISCSPASGSTFPIGTTTVHCTATDPSGNSSSGSFSVVVKGAAAQVKDLITMVNGDHLSSSLQTALDNKLNDALTAINAGQTTTACSNLTDFIGFVQSHTGKGLTSSQATQLIAAAKQVQAVLGC